MINLRWLTKQIATDKEVEDALKNYYTKEEIVILLNGKADKVHSHAISDVVNLDAQLNLRNPLLLSSVATNELEVGTSWTDILSLTVTKSSTYLLMSSASIFAEGAGSTQAETRIVIDDTEVSGSIRSTRNLVIMALGLIGGNNIDGSGGNTVIPNLTISENSVVKLQARRVAGTKITINSRSLNLLKTVL